MEDGQLRLVLAFGDQSPSFAMGFECGQIWARMSNQEEIDEIVHHVNLNQIQAMCEAKNYKIAALINLENETHLEIKLLPCDRI